MSEQKNIILICVLAILTLPILFVAVQPFNQQVESANPKFVISSWDYPDEYGQGIEYISIYENSTGAWVLNDTMHYYDTKIFNWEAGIAIRLGVGAWFNSTLTGASDNVTGRNYLRHNVIVTNSSDEVVFSQNNFTYSTVNTFLNPPMWRYSYVVVLDFLPVNGQMYTVNVDYEVYYLGGSGEYEASEQSITSFSETLVDDVLYYPDAFTFNEMTATSSNNSDYWKLNATDEQYLESYDPYNVIIYFDTGDIGGEGFNYSIYSTVPFGNISIWNYTAGNWDCVISYPTIVAGWNNGTFTSTDYFSEGLDYSGLTILLHGSFSYDYFGISLIGMALADSGYAEPFSDVSDWASGDYPMDAGDTFTSDGDLLSMKCKYNVGDQSDSIKFTGLSLSTSSYFELRYKVNATKAGGGADRVYLRINDDASNYHQWSEDPSDTNWHTIKFLISSLSKTNNPTEITYVQLMCYFDTSTDEVDFQVDYLRISPGNEMGWQHDGSTTIGISSSDGGTITSDGDAVTLTADIDGATFIIPVDITATAAAIATTYYPFFSWKINSGSGYILIQQWDGAAYATLRANSSIVAGTKYRNMKSLDTSIYWWRITFTGSSIATFDYFQAYGIANWTYAGTGTNGNDVLYVTEDTLYCSRNAFTSMILDHDPALSVSTSFGDLWSITTSSGTPQTDYYVDGSWAGYSSETEGDLAAGTLTDVRIKFTASANIAAISFLTQIDGWALVSEAIFMFIIPVDETALNWFLIFLGLFMIPASTLYLVKGGRDNMSMNKVFFFIVAFILGWALVIGGIFA